MSERYAVHNIHVPAILLDTDGTCSLNGRDRIGLPEPMHTASTFDDAEAWRFAELEKLRK